VEVAKVFDGAAIPFEHFTDHIDRADIVISSTGAPHFVITKPMAERIIKHRKNKPVFFIDIAVPRDIDPAVNEIDNVFLYDIDDLQQVIDANLKERLKEAHRAEEIIDGEVHAFCARMQAREVVPMIVEMRALLERQRHDEIDRYRKKLKDFSPEQLAIVDQITESLMNKFLHSPITQLKGMAHDPRGAEFAETVRKLFNIQSSTKNDESSD
jgi:glutamyl-tRNA reductase